MWIIRNVQHNTYAYCPEKGEWDWTDNRLFACRWETRAEAYKVAMAFYRTTAFAIERY